MPSYGDEEYGIELMAQDAQPDAVMLLFRRWRLSKIDENGTYKYVLLRLQSMESSGSSRLLVRGSQQAGYHRDVVHMAQEACAGGEGQVSMVFLAADPLCSMRLTDMPAATGITLHNALHMCQLRKWENISKDCPLTIQACTAPQMQADCTL